MQNPTAAIVVIGNEILSGRTLDTNTQHIAQSLLAIGIRLLETRTIIDDCEIIVETILALKDKYDYIFTTGGIGPTHDDITSEAIAKAFKVPLVIHPVAYEILQNFYLSKGEKLNPAREKMAYVPEGSKLISNSVSAAPGFIIQNVHVFAGVPDVMRTMLEQVLPTLRRGATIHSKSLRVRIGESIIAKAFADLQNKYPEVEMGSYPFIDDTHGSELVLRSIDMQKLEQSYLELQKIIDSLRL